MNNDTSQSGVVAVFMALVMLVILVSSGLVFSSILSRQLFSSEDISSSERAFYAANSGLEKALYDLVKLNKGETDIIGDGQIMYDSEVATYKVEKASLSDQPEGKVPCVVSSGTFRTEVRRVTIGVCP